MKLKKIGKGIMIAVIIVIAIFMVGLAGQADQDEYIEVNLTPKARFLN